MKSNRKLIAYFCFWGVTAFSLLVWNAFVAVAGGIMLYLHELFADEAIREHEDNQKGIVKHDTLLTDMNGEPICEGDWATAEYMGSSAGPYRGQIQYDPKQFGYVFCNSPLWCYENWEKCKHQES